MGDLSNCMCISMNLVASHHSTLKIPLYLGLFTVVQGLFHQSSEEEDEPPIPYRCSVYADLCTGPLEHISSSAFPPPQASSYHGVIQRLDFHMCHSHSSNLLVSGRGDLGDHTERNIIERIHLPVIIHTRRTGCMYIPMHHCNHCYLFYGELQNRCIQNF